MDPDQELQRRSAGRARTLLRDRSRCSKATPLTWTAKFELRRTCEWNHGLGEIVTAVVDAGLRIAFVHEHREVPWQALPKMEPVGPGTAGADGRYQSNRMWRLRGAAGPVAADVLAAGDETGSVKTSGQYSQLTILLRSNTIKS
ncbi:MAG: hypothetical protein IPI73_12650 [Betaproteobacteria bacterium]|nr:hypothetical protein [Betaproteobacteria bacterium]